jgi:sugar lactone lactonase YvrE
MKWSRGRYLVAAGVAAAIIAIVVVVIVSPWSGKDEVVVPPIPGVTSDTEPRPVTDKVWPAKLVLHVDLDPSVQPDPSKQADQPADVALLDGNMFLADAANGRLLEVSADGTTFHILDKQVDPKLALSSPMAIASHQGQLYVADSGAGQVLIVTPSGTVSRAISLAKGSSTDASPPRPVGIVVWGDGSFAVSDGNNYRLIKYSADGVLLWTVGTGARAAGQNGFNVPGGLALDKQGNVYVVDSLNSQVKKYSADGTYLSGFGQTGDTAGSFSRAKAVAVDDAGNIYVSDGLQAAVQVFDPAGIFLGFIGRKDPADPKSTSLFQTPHGVRIVDGKLYIVDRFAGLFVFDLQAS